ncbi:hypothetical protein BASA81_001918 [Batrachochytrium salamandrivorans]|nr:hypothetical protein BASA81_001918 [Batrachochytrium salamandrivorans]
MQGNLIAEIMNKEGPIVKTVVLRSNGKVDQVEIDMTSSKNELAKVLGGELTIIGQLSVLDCVMLKLSDEEDNFEARKLVTNTHKLPHPFHDEEHLGDILLMRMDEESEPLSLTSKEWSEFLKSAPFTSEAYEQWKITHKLEEEDDEDEEEQDFTPEEEQVLEKIMTKLAKKLGEEPTKDQVIEALAQSGNTEIAEKLTLMSDDDSGSEDEPFTAEEDAIIERCAKFLAKKLRTDPTKAQVIEALTKGGNAKIAEKLAALPEEDSEDSEDDFTEAEDAILEKTMTQLAKKLRSEPTKDQVIEALKKNGNAALAEKLAQMVDLEDEEDEEDDEDDEDEDEDKEEDEDEEAADALEEKVFVELQSKLGRDPTEEEMMMAIGDKIPDNFTEEEMAFMSNFLETMENELEREPEEEEVYAALAKLGKHELIEKLKAEAGGSDDSDGEDFSPEDQAYLSDFIDTLTKKLKRTPEEQDIMQALASSRDEYAQGLLERMMSAEGGNSESEEEDSESEDDEPPAKKQKQSAPSTKQQQQAPKGKPQQAPAKSKQQQQQQAPKNKQQQAPAKNKQQQRGPPQRGGGKHQAKRVKRS